MSSFSSRTLALLALCTLVAPLSRAAEPRSFSGIYPNLAMFNNEGECGTGAVVPWAGKLWVVTYAPHSPRGSSDKLYEISKELQQTVRPESIGGTPANRMIHRESNQLFIGPYAISAQGVVRPIPYTKMFGRPTANARHLTDPAGKIYYTTMEEGVYEVDVKTLEVKELWADEATKTGRHSDLPGYHGKGSYTGQGVLIYANNGDHAKETAWNPAVPSGALAEWDGQDDKFTLVRRNQFTEVTGPDGIYGASKPESEPIWTIGWDHRSLIFMLRQEGQWQTFRLPKGSHSYDGSHGWNTEWPRIREIGGDEMMMTMHGTFWHFPKSFSAGKTAGIAPRSNYLKVIGDFCRWGDKIVLGCDDTAKAEFLNKRGTKGALAGPGQSQSNLWFVKPEQLDQLGPVIGTGGVWVDEAVKANTPSEPFLFSGYAHRGLHLSTGQNAPVEVKLEVDQGDGKWAPLRDLKVEGYHWIAFKPEEKGAWIRIAMGSDLPKVSAVFAYSNEDKRATDPDAMFQGIATLTEQDYSTAVMLTRGNNERTLGLSAKVIRDGKETSEGYYELSADMKLEAKTEPPPVAKGEKDAKVSAVKEEPGGSLKQRAAVPENVISSDAASVLVIDGKKRRWRLPKSNDAYEQEGPQLRRVCREIATERDLLNAYGTVYELPAENASGYAKMRPVATHAFNIVDYVSYRGLLILSGISAKAAAGEHIIKSEDGKVAVWAGAVDDLWKLGHPRGHGGPWMKTAVAAGQPSDPYLIRGYDRKTLALSHTAAQPVTMAVEVDVTGDGQWVPYGSYTVENGKPYTHEFPAGFSAYWLRVQSDTACEATAQLEYK